MANLKKAYKTIVEDNFPKEMTISFGDQTLVYRKRTWKIEEDGAEIERGLRYGENPGQESALYELVNGNLVLGDCKFIDPGNGLVSSLDEAMMLQFGKHPGKINLTDIDAALNIVKYLMDSPAAAVMKHNNPSGVAKGAGAADAIEKAFMTDRLAAMGGCVAVNRPIDKAAAEFIAANYVEVVVAPSYESGAIEILKDRKNLRIVQIPRIDQLGDYRTAQFLDFKSLIDGGLIVQSSMVSRIISPDDFIPAATTPKKGEPTTCDRTPTDQEYADMIFGWNVELGVTSNSVLFVKDGVTVSIGTGEQDRVGCAEIAVHKAYAKHADRLCFEKFGMPYNEYKLAVEKGEKDAADLQDIDTQTTKAKGGLIGSAMISDGFFPFRDGVDVGIRQGITAVAQPGGSMRDKEVIQACNEADPKVAMVFTGQRAFKH
ncbi:MAG: IMP cyclohydrolase [Deltaproteobacteria bacterium]|nr:IMP cyclohydrolase [Deltaproteobacteria bacterium]MBN2671883.1 IMP cyclohydrolase [Deltaproteobacteria bacterium]